MVFCFQNRSFLWLLNSEVVSDHVFLKSQMRKQNNLKSFLSKGKNVRKFQNAKKNIPFQGEMADLNNYETFCK